jgi:beta-ketoacyl synthase-like protein
MGSIVSWCQIRKNKVLKDGKTLVDLATMPLDDFLLKAYEHFQLAYPKYYKMDRLSKLGLLASEILLKGNATNPETTAVILSNSHASLDTDIRFWESAQIQASPSLFVYTLPNIVAGEICIRNGFKGESIFFVSPAFDAPWMASYVDMVLQNGKTDACLAGWVDVIGDDAEVFLYLTDKSSGRGKPHTAATVSELHQTWNN